MAGSSISDIILFIISLYIRGIKEQKIVCLLTPPSLFKPKKISLTFFTFYIFMKILAPSDASSLPSLWFSGLVAISLTEMHSCQSLPLHLLNQNPETF